MANPYYRSGKALKAKNEQAGGAALDVPEFAFAQVALDSVQNALDIGCGWGRFAVPLARRRQVLLTCVDVWPGMVETCRHTLGDAGLDAAFIAGDARFIPVASSAFDLVMANHMLYEFDRDELRLVVAELGRVVARDGVVLATTYSDAVPIPMTELHNETLAALGFAPPGAQPSSFCLENGADVLSESFANVETAVMEDVRSDTDAAALTELYLKTGGYHWARNHEPIPERDRAQIPEVFASRAQDRIDRDGAIVTVTKWTAFVAHSPRLDVSARA